jgi:hypothetical protein
MLASGMTANMSDISAKPYSIEQDASTTEVAESTSNGQAALVEVKGTAVTTKFSANVASTESKEPVKEKKNPNKAVESRVREYFSDLPIMAEVAKCESRYRQFNADGSIFRGIVNDQDVGALQINEYYHAKRAKKLGIDIRSLEGNLEYARLLYTEEGTRPWKSSSPCWMKSEVAKAMAASKLAEK